MKSELYAIIDAELADSPIVLARRALRFGCAYLQLRAKRLDDRAFLAMATTLRAMCAEARTPFVVNDRADLAALVDADVLHLGQDDMDIRDARRIVGDMAIGLSTHDPAQAARAEREGADLIAFGPVFPTRSKDNPDPVVGLDALAAVASHATRPVIAIGGITPENAAETLEAGARYVAVISALPRFVGGP